jgi:hypothetical protein
MAGLGKQLRGVRIARVLKAEGGSVEDMSQIQEVMEPEIKKSKENKAGKMVKDAARGFKEGVKKVAKAPFDAAETIVESFKKLKDPEFRKKAGIGQPYMGPSRKEYKKGGMVKKGKK